MPERGGNVSAGSAIRPYWLGSSDTGKGGGPNPVRLKNCPPIGEGKKERRTSRQKKRVEHFCKSSTPHLFLQEKKGCTPVSDRALRCSTAWARQRSWGKQGKKKPALRILAEEGRFPDQRKKGQRRVALAEKKKVDIGKEKKKGNSIGKQKTSCFN